MEHIICDIDGTLADLAARRKFIEGPGKKDWDAFFDPANLANDVPIAPIITVLRCLANSAFGTGNTMVYRRNVWFVSGRPERTRHATMLWLAAHVLGPKDPNHHRHIDMRALLMRRDGDRRSDDIVKSEILQNILTQFGIRPDNSIVLDDRDRVVQMWRNNGFKVLQVAPGDF